MQRPAGLYRVKPEAQRLLGPILSRGVSADTVTLAAIPVAALGGLLLALSDSKPLLLLIVPFVAALGPLLALAAVIAALLASYVGITARALGAPRQCGGVMSKPGRMMAISIVAPFSFVMATPWPLLAAAWIIPLGSLLTLAQRIVSTRNALVRAQLTHASDATDGAA